MNEPTITINNRALTESQATTVRCAIESFAVALRDNDEVGEIRRVYLERIDELRALMAIAEPRGDVVAAAKAIVHYYEQTPGPITEREFGPLARGLKAALMKETQ